MTNLVAGNTAVDLTTWAFTPGWHGVSHSATQFVIAQDSTGRQDTFTGTGFGGYDIYGFPTTGTVTGIVFAQNGQTLTTLSDFSMSVTELRNYSSHQNMAGFQAALLAGNDSLTDSPQGDHFFGLTGNDTFHMTHGGSDIAEGNEGDDTFDMGAALNGGDTLVGGSGNNTLSLNGDYSGGVTLNATTISDILTLNVAAGHNYSLTLDDGNVAADATFNVHAEALGAANWLALDGGAETDGRFVMTGGAGADQFTGGSGDDWLEGRLGNDNLSGGGGRDTASYQHASAAVNVDLDAGTSSGADGADTLDTIEDLIGSNFNDTLAGNGGGNTLTGGAGNDTIYGGPGGVIDAVPADASVGIQDADHDLVNGLGGSADFGEDFLAANDDGSTTAIDITSVFGAAGIDFFGTEYTSLYVNNNGNITFAAPTGQFTPSVIDAGIGNPIIAAFWADVDTRGPLGTISEGGNSTGSDLVWYDLDAANGVFTVTWDDVGYYSAHDDLVNAFQLQLIDQGDGDFDIVFRYENVDWTAGDASGGSGGHGGTPARAGYSAGNGSDYFELSQSGNEAAMLGLPDAAGNTGVDGVYLFQVRNGQVIGQDDDTLYGGTGNDQLFGGAGNDLLRGAAGVDYLYGGDGNDRFAGGRGTDFYYGDAGNDTFYFNFDPAVAGRQVDTIVGFDPLEDKIDIDENFHVTALEETIVGHGNFEDLADDLGSHHAVLVWRGHQYSILIDTNGTVGYQRGDDIRIALDSPVHLDQLDVHAFV